MLTLGVILARAGSKGLANKHLIELLGRPVVDYTIEHALASRLSGIVVSTDCPGVKAIAQSRGVRVVDRPAELARDDSSVQDALLHVVDALEATGHPRIDAVVVLYGNVPVRPRGLIDRAIDLLTQTGCDSVRSFCAVGKWHPAWMSKLEGDRVVHMSGQGTHRRQDLEAMFLHEGGVLASSRSSLDRGRDDRSNPHAFFGVDRRAVRTNSDDVVEIDAPRDLLVAETALRAQRCVSIAGRALDRVHPPCVIAEIGVNHDGSVDRALELVDAAADAGADAVKLQLFSADRLVRADARTAAYQQQAGGGDNQWSLLRKLELDAQAVTRVVEAIRSRKLIPLATPFSIEDVDLIEALDLPAVKIASPDLVNRPLLQRAMRTGKPLLISTGASSHEEIVETLRWLCGHPSVLLHCVSTYPVEPGAEHLHWITHLRDTFAMPVGYSDHTTTDASALDATRLGACVIEKHLTYDRRAAGPDHSASADPEQFRAYVRQIRACHETIVHGRVPLEGEDDVRRLSRQSLVASRAIEAGSILVEADLTTRRPGDGIGAASVHAVIGCRARTKIMLGTTLQWDMLHAKA